MMNRLFNRNGFLCVQALILPLLVLCFFRFSEAKTSYLDSQQNLADCKQIATEIGQMRQLQSVACDQTAQADLNNKNLIRLLRKTGINESQLGSLTTLPVTKVPETEYERHDVSIDLNAVSVEQLLRLVIGIEKRFSTTKATSLNMRANRTRVRTTARSGELWNAQVTLTQLVYLARTAR